MGADMLIQSLGLKAKERWQVFGELTAFADEIAPLYKNIDRDKVRFILLVKVRVRGRLAWFVRRSYYLFQMMGWSRRMRIVIDWTFTLLFRPEIVKIDLNGETSRIFHEPPAENTRPAGSAAAVTPLSSQRSENEEPTPFGVDE